MKKYDKEILRYFGAVEHNVLAEKYYLYLIIHFNILVDYFSLRKAVLERGNVLIERMGGAYEWNYDNISSEPRKNNFLIIKKTSFTTREVKKRSKSEEFCMISALYRDKRRCVEFAINPENCIYIPRLRGVLDVIGFLNENSSLMFLPNKRVYFFTGMEVIGKTYILGRIEDEVRRELNSFAVASYKENFVYISNSGDVVALDNQDFSAPTFPVRDLLRLTDKRKSIQPVKFDKAFLFKAELVLFGNTLKSDELFMEKGSKFTEQTCYKFCSKIDIPGESCEYVGFFKVKLHR